MQLTIVFKCGQINLICFRYFPLILLIMFGWKNKGKRFVLKISTCSVLHFFEQQNVFNHLLSWEKLFLKNQISMMKRLLALISIRKLKRMKAKPLKRHCIFPKRHKNLSDKAAKEPDGFLKKIALMAFNFSFIFPLKSGSLRAQKYSLNEMKNWNRLVELIHSNQGWKSKRDIKKTSQKDVSDV